MRDAVRLGCGLLDERVDRRLSGRASEGAKGSQMTEQHAVTGDRKISPAFGTADSRCSGN